MLLSIITRTCVRMHTQNFIKIFKLKMGVKKIGYIYVCAHAFLFIEILYNHIINF